MSQPSIAAYFTSRKRAVIDDALTTKNRRLLEATDLSHQTSADSTKETSSSSIQHHDDNSTPKGSSGITATPSMRTRSGRVVKCISVQQPVHGNKISKIEQSFKQQKKLVEFVKKGSLSPRKKLTPKKNREVEPTSSSNTNLTNIFALKNNETNIERGLKTPTKQIIKSTNTPIKRTELKSLVKKELNFDDVKTKISRSAKMQQLKASLARINDLEQARKAQEERNRRLREAGPTSTKADQFGVQLKEFNIIELEVLASPSKTFKTPSKLPPPTPDKNELMSPRHTNVSKRLLFSPSKDGTSPAKVIIPAYERFMSLAEPTKAGQLPLPYKYRNLIEIFKCLDSVCAMFFNRRECITFKKLKPAVQRMLRKNFTETHLAQIKHLYPEAYTFSQMKMRNYGSVSKSDYFQLVIIPNVEQKPKEKQQTTNEDDVLASAASSAMNPHVMTERLQHFTHLLLERLKSEHDKFLKSLDPPISIQMDKVTRWHPDFDLENCVDIELAVLPQPPNVEKYTSARDILSTARNLFNCATPMERTMERYEAHLKTIELENSNEDNVKPLDAALKATETATPTVNTAATTDLLKGLPKSLIEKIRTKQAAKALDAMTRRPSQDQEATKYARLPELARHLRNVFITEHKSVLTLEIIIKRIQNSYRTLLTSHEIEAHLKLIAKEVPAWVAFHEVRKTMYLKIAKDMDIKQVFTKLKSKADEKSK